MEDPHIDSIRCRWALDPAVACTAHGTSPEGNRRRCWECIYIFSWLFRSIQLWYGQSFGQTWIQLVWIQFYKDTILLVWTAFWSAMVLLEQASLWARAHQVSRQMICGLRLGGADGEGPKSTMGQDRRCGFSWGHIDQLLMGWIMLDQVGSGWIMLDQWC